ncbi:MAG TPA: hypothetical protein VLV89_04945 [Candidatus Acidoferrum sp.]|nr:hypothetical protein [Candidatus Acidoferrum sp.]
MNDRPRLKLTELVRTEGSALLGNPQRVHELLQASCPDCPGEVMALSAAMRQGLPTGLISAAGNPGTRWPEFSAGWMQHLQTAEQMPSDYASWAIDSWAMALGIAIGPVSAPPAQTFTPSAQPQIPQAAPLGYQPSAAQPMQPGPGVPYAAPGTAPYAASQAPGYPAGFPQVAPAKSGKKGPLGLVVALIAVAAVAGYFIVRSRFDSGLVGNWQTTYADGQVIWPRTWQLSSLGNFQVSENVSDTGVMVVGGTDNVRILRSTRLGNLEVTYNFQGPDKVLFSGPLLGPEGNRAWTWSTVDRGIPNPGKYTFVGTWLNSTPQHGLTGSMSFTVAYDASYKFAASYSATGKMQAKGGNYTILTATGAVVETGTYQFNGSNQVTFRSSNGINASTWTRSQ